MKAALLVMRAAILCSIFCLAGCATTQQADDVKPGGFLRDYSMLRPGKGDQALLTYRNRNAAWGRYNKIIIDPVAIYAGRDSDIKDDATKEDRRTLAAYFTAVLNEEIGKHFTIVKSPGEGVLRLRVALTDADQSEVLLDTITTIMPIGLALSAVKRMTFGSDSFVGFAQAEAEVIDSRSMVRLAAAVDKRYGTKALRSKFGSWNQAKEAMDHWAEQIAERLVEFGSGYQES